MDDHVDDDNANQRASLNQRKWLRLKPIDLSSLPPHPGLGKDYSRPPLATFIAEVLAEALAMTDARMRTGFHRKSTKTSPPATAKVEQLVYEVPAGNSSPAETWFGRRSEHLDLLRKGTATMQEFEDGLFHDHNINEEKYTPDLYDAHKAWAWDVRADGGGETDAQLAAQGWTDAHAEVWEMCHKLPAPLERRVFSIAVVRARVDASRGGGFVTAQVPVALGRHKLAFYTSGRHIAEGNSASRRARTVVGRYVSVERVRRHAVNDNLVVWEMATASDAGGSIPAIVQKWGTPGAIVRDVGNFMDWRQRERAKAVA